MIEKRQYDRFLLVTEIDQHRKDDSENTIQSTSKNLSASGICITTENDPLIDGEIYVLCFILPGQSKQFMLEGKVMWSKRDTSGHVNLYDNGLAFTHITKEQREIIEEYRLGSVFEE
jgi:Tfp pilus assembly protein PilZ